MGDQIWIWFEFANKEDKQKYLDWIEENEISSNGKATLYKDGHESTISKVCYAKDMYMHNDSMMTQETIDHWTKD